MCESLWTPLKVIYVAVLGSFKVLAALVDKSVAVEPESSSALTTRVLLGGSSAVVVLLDATDGGGGGSVLS